MKEEFYFKSKDIKYSIEYIDSKDYKNSILNYKRNNIKLNYEVESKSTEKIEEKELEEKFLNDIKRTIYSFFNPVENVILLAGAGASIVTDDKGNINTKYGKTMIDLSKKIFEDFNEKDKLKELNELINKINYEYQIGEEEYNKDFNLENFLSQLIMYEKFIKNKRASKKNQEIKDEIFKIIVDNVSYDFNSEKNKHGAIIKTLSNLQELPNKLTIVTTNYDCLFEEAAEYLKYTVFDGFSFSKNAVFNPELFDFSLVKPIQNVKSDKFEYKKSCINLLKIHGSINWEDEKGEIIRKTQKSENPIIIFPSSDKYMYSYQKPYFQLFSKFQELLKVKNTLLITTGFSFSDDHISEMILQSVKTNESLVVIITDYTLKDRDNKNWKEFENLMNNGFKVAFLKSTLGTDLSWYFGAEINDN